jgi:hypothetical protein
MIRDCRPRTHDEIEPGRCWEARQKLMKQIAAGRFKTAKRPFDQRRQDEARALAKHDWNAFIVFARDRSRTFPPEFFPIWGNA